MSDMTYMDHVRAKELLSHLLPIARSKLTEGSIRGEAKSLVAKSQAPYYSEDRMAGIHIYHAPLGGWIADLIFRDMPPGIPNALGTPVHSPFRTREEAREGAIGMLAAILEISDQNEGREAVHEPVFQLYDCIIRIDGGILNEIVALGKQLGVDEPYENIDDLTRRLEAVLKEVFGEQKPSHDLFLAKSKDNKIKLLSILHLCSLNGVFRYPAPEPAVVTE